MASDYARALGARLRAIRTQQGLSLHGVEEKSEGRWKAVVVGSYERGDRAVTVQRLGSDPARNARWPRHSSSAAAMGPHQAGRCRRWGAMVQAITNNWKSVSRVSRGRCARRWRQVLNVEPGAGARKRAAASNGPAATGDTVSGDTLDSSNIDISTVMRYEE